MEEELRHERISQENNSQASVTTPSRPASSLGSIISVEQQRLRTKHGSIKRTLSQGRNSPSFRKRQLVSDFLPPGEPGSPARAVRLTEPSRFISPNRRSPLAQQLLEVDSDDEPLSQLPRRQGGQIEVQDFELPVSSVLPDIPAFVVQTLPEIPDVVMQDVQEDLGVQGNLLGHDFLDDLLTTPAGGSRAPVGMASSSTMPLAYYSTACRRLQILRLGTPQLLIGQARVLGRATIRRLPSIRRTERGGTLVQTTYMYNQLS